MITKSGKKTHGLGRFFSGLQNQPVSGLSFFCLSLVSIEQQKAFPVRLEQQLPSSSKAKTKGGKTTSKRKVGRPKGSTNKDKTQVNLTGELRLIRGMISALLTLIGGQIPLTYVLLDGHFGNNNALQMVAQLHLHLISKLRYDSKLFLPVVLLKTNLETQQQAHVILFSSDLTLDPQTLIKYYSLRFQIEFNFRDAKQFWGLEDFMNTNEQGVINAANLSFFMVNLSSRLLQPMKFTSTEFSILDLKALRRG